MSSRDRIQRFVEKLAELADYGFQGEKPVAIYAMLRTAKIKKARMTGLELLSRYPESIREYFLSHAGKYERLKDPKDSWRVITGSARELQQFLEGDTEADAAFALLTDGDIAALLSWFETNAEEDGTNAAT